MCVDFRKLNSQTIPINFPMPHPQEALDSFARATVFSTLDLVSGFHQIPIAETDRFKTAFRSTKGSTNSWSCQWAWSTPQRFFSEPCTRPWVPFVNPGGAALSTWMILSSSLRPWMSTKSTSTKFFRHFVSSNGLSPDPAKLEIIQDWPQLTTLSALRSFIRMVQYCRRFVPNISKILAPLAKLTGIDTPFVWTPQCAAAFARIKELIASAPTLAMPDPKPPFQVYSDASIDGTGGILMQNGRIAFSGHKFSDVERRWSTADQGLYALVSNFEHWRCYLGRSDEH